MSTHIAGMQATFELLSSLLRCLGYSQCKSTSRSLSLSLRNGGNVSSTWQILCSFGPSVVWSAVSASHLANAPPSMFSRIGSPGHKILICAKEIYESAV